ncbi:MAG: uroporphyrinogen-III synthase [Bacteroidetes bacterium]|nr:uroporphyrinogen-III synthase [Bacteroidota bacterium]
MYTDILKNKSIFISRKIENTSIFNKLITEYDVSLNATSLISIVRIPFSYTPKTDWIFFTSKNAINFFFAQNPDINDSIKYGVISNSSANELKLHKKEAHFIGQGTDLLKIAKTFRETLGNASVLFPQAMDSMQTIQKQLAFSNTVYNLYTYKTIIQTNINVPYADILVFTSPSNVTAYYNQYKPDSRQIIIGMGNSTKYRLSEFGVKNVLVPAEFSENGLYKCIIDICQ